MRLIIIPLLMAVFCPNLVGQSPLVVGWKIETPMSSQTDLAFGKVAIDPDTNILRVLQVGYNSEIAISKLTVSGEMVFEKTWALPASSATAYVPQIFSMDHEGNSILLIDQRNYSPVEEVLHYVSYDRNGMVRWDRAESLPSQDIYFRSAAVDEQNNIIFAGSITNWFVAQKISSSGELIWRNPIQPPNVLYSWAADVAVDGAGRTVVVGTATANTGDLPVIRRFETTGEAGEVWTNSTAKSGLGNVLLTQSGAIYVTDWTTVFRIDANGQTEWSRPLDGGLPHVAAVMDDETVIVSSPNGFSIWDKTGKTIGSGSYTGEYFTQNIRSRGESLFVSRGPRISELRRDGSLVSEINLGEGHVVQDIAITGNSDVAFVGVNVGMKGDRAVFSGVIIHSALVEAPHIEEQPRGATLAAGSDFTASVGAAGSNLQYQWFFGASVSSQVALEGQTNSILLLTNTQVSQSGKYWVEVSNAFGKVSSAYAELAVGLLPTITANPTTVPSRPYVGERVVWRYSASATQPLGTQWYKEGSPIPNATNLSYVIQVSSPADYGKYSVQVTNLFGEAMSDPVEFPKFLENVEMTVLTNEVLFGYGDVAKDAEGNVYLAGRVSELNRIGAVAAKFDSNGQLVWRTNLSQLEVIVSRGPRTVYSVGEDGAMYIPGRTNGTPVLYKLDKGGTVAWVANLKSEMNAIAGAETGRLHSYVVGTFLTGTKRALVVVALDPDGTRVWTRSIEVTAAIDASSWVQVTSDEHIYVGNYSGRIFHLLNSSGSVFWTNSLSTNALINARVGPENSLYLGIQSGQVGACAKYNSEGEKVWSRTLRAPSNLNIETTTLEVDGGGNAYLAGAGSSALTKIDGNGSMQYNWSSGDTYPSRRLLTTESNGIYMLTDQFAGNFIQGAFLSKYDANGIRRWSRNLPSQYSYVPCININDREVFAFTPGRLFKFRDLEMPEMEKISATIERDVIGTNPVLRLEIEGAAAKKVIWYRNGIPEANLSRGTGFGETIIPRFSSSGLYYSVEIETEEAVIATPDHLFDAFAAINNVRSEDENLYFTMRGLSNQGYRIQRSRNLVDWEDYGAATLGGDGTSQIAIPIGTQQNEYFRGIK